MFIFMYHGNQYGMPAPSYMNMTEYMMVLLKKKKSAHGMNKDIVK